MELTGTISPDVIMPLWLLLSVWDQKKLLVTPAQGNHHWSQRLLFPCSDFPFSVREPLKLKLSHTHPNNSWSSGKSAILKIVGKSGMLEKEKAYGFDCLFWARKGIFFARAVQTVESQALGCFFATKQLAGFYLKKCGMVSLTKRCRTMHSCLETSTSVR